MPIVAGIPREVRPMSLGVECHNGQLSTTGMTWICKVYEIGATTDVMQQKQILIYIYSSNYSESNETVLETDRLLTIIFG